MTRDQLVDRIRPIRRDRLVLAHLLQRYHPERLHRAGVRSRELVRNRQGTSALRRGVVADAHTLQLMPDDGASAGSDPEGARRPIKRRASIVTHQHASEHGMPRGPHHE
jgi:hypothetical protein